jgi:prepilin-type N-terminal cleavage/methylation domain-containing protein
MKMKKNRTAFTLIELLVVVLILGLLSTIAVGVFTSQVERARYAAAKSTISAIELAVNRYQIDIGQYPPSGSKSDSVNGCGYMQLALMHSLSGSSSLTSGTLWHGPYMTVRNEQLGDMSGTTFDQLASIDPGDVQILDPWRTPYRYIRSGPSPDNYAAMLGTKLPASNPFASTEIYYNPSTFQVASKGSNSESPEPETGNFGTDSDDVTNFGQ